MYELEYNGVGISKMPTDRLTQSFHEMCAEYKRRGLSATDYLPDSMLPARARDPRLTEAQESAFREGYSLGQTDGSAMDGCMGCYDPAPVDDVETAWKESDTCAAFAGDLGEVERLRKELEKGGREMSLYGCVY